MRSVPRSSRPTDAPTRDAATRDAASGRPRRGPRVDRAHGLLAGATALLALAAVPVTHTVPEVGETVSEVLGGAATPPTAGPDADDDAALQPGAGVDAHAPAVRAVRAATEGTTTVERTSLRSPGTLPTERTPDREEPDGADPDEPDAGEDDDEAPGDGADDAHAASHEEQGQHAPGGTRWDRLADCESGEWDARGAPIPGTARWDYGLGFAHEGYEQFEGGVNFHADTWDAYRDPAMPDHAGRATRDQQIAVAERVLAEQGWQAWPVCSQKMGLR